MSVQLEHANITVSNPEATAKWLGDVFGWAVRWQGASINGGRSVHVGSDNSYLALYSPKDAPDPQSGSTYTSTGGLNHLAVVVDDLDAVEAKVLKAGFKTGSHADYEPGRRFYFHDNDNIEFEVVSYDK